MGNVIVTLKNSLNSISNMTIRFVKESISSHYAVNIPFSSIFTYMFKTSTSSPSCYFSKPTFQTRLEQVKGLHCILDETQQSLSTDDSMNNDYSNNPVVDPKPHLFIRKRKVRKSLPIVPTNRFLLYCFTCNKNLNGKDIYIYRGEWSFCSVDCRIEGIKATHGNSDEVDTYHLLSSQASKKHVDNVIFYVDGHQ